MSCRDKSLVGSSGRTVERRTVKERGRWFNPTYRRFETKAISFCLCLSEETLKAGGPFYLVSMPGEVKDPTQEVNM